MFEATTHPAELEVKIIERALWKQEMEGSLGLRF